MGYSIDLSKNEFTEEDCEKIITETTRIINDDKQDIMEVGTAYYNRGIIFYKKKEEDKAILDFTKAIEIMPDYAPVYFMRASSYYLFYEDEKALIDAQKALQLDETNSKYADFVSELIKMNKDKEQKIEKMTNNLLKGYEIFQEILEKNK